MNWGCTDYKRKSESKSENSFDFLRWSLSKTSMDSSGLQGIFTKCSRALFGGFAARPFTKQHALR